jgi:hypothetical protein
MGETLLGLLLVVTILGVSAVLTHLFARAMYLTCPNCRTLNARRRTQCRKCGQKIRG